MRRLVVALSLIACSPAPRPAPPPLATVPAPSAPPPAVVTAPASPFHVIGVREWKSLKTANPTRICAIDGAVFLCGVDAVVRLDGTDLVKDAALEKGLLRKDDGGLHGRIESMLGRFPDDAWLLMRTGWNVGTVAAYRFGEGWSLVKKWKIEFVGGQMEFMNWGPGQLVVLDASTESGFAVEIVGANVALPAIPKAKKKDALCPLWLRSPELGLDRERSLILYGGRCDVEGPGWLRLVPGAKVAETHDGEPPSIELPESAYRITGENLERRSAPGTYETVLLPESPSKERLVPFQVHADGKDVVVAARFGKNNVAILHNAPPARAPLTL